MHGPGEPGTSKPVADEEPVCHQLFGLPNSGPIFGSSGVEPSRRQVVHSGWRHLQVFVTPRVDSFELRQQDGKCGSTAR
jgi:hypothetical protein